MAEITTTADSYKPTNIEKPDMRFATTFISNKYRDYAVNGESLMDKATGEIFTKRPFDGRVVSFFQNKKYMHDLMLELRVLLNNNGSFRYPAEEDVDSYYISTDYDMMSIFNERDVDILTSDFLIPNSSTAETSKLIFNISKKSNGFFCRLTSRDSDKAVIEFLTNQYNSIISYYVGDNEGFLLEKEKFNSIEKWYDSNATITYEVKVKDGQEVYTQTLTDYVRINEESCVLYPETIGNSILENSDNVTVTIKSITFDKIHFMYKYRASFSSEVITGMNKLITPDKAIHIRYCNICSFIDESEDLVLHGNEFIVALLDVPYVRRYMMKMSKLNSDANIVISPTRPSDDIWLTNGIWAEQVRIASQGGEEIHLDCEVDLVTLENYLSTSDATEYVTMSTNPNLLNSIYMKEEVITSEF